MVLTYGIFPTSVAASTYSPSVIGSVPIIVYQAMQMRTDDVHCRESAGTGPVVLKVVPVTGAAFSGFAAHQLVVCASTYPRPLLVWSGYSMSCAIHKVSAEAACMCMYVYIYVCMVITYNSRT